jgi:hypothetical protein
MVIWGNGNIKAEEGCRDLRALQHIQRKAGRGDLRAEGPDTQRGETTEGRGREQTIGQRVSSVNLD